MAEEEYYQADELVGFSDDEGDDIRTRDIPARTLDSEIATQNKDLDLLAALLEQSSSKTDSKVKPKKVLANEGKDRESSLLSRVQEMEMEITELRQKVQEGEILQQGASTPKFSRKAVTNSANHNVDHKPARARAGVCSAVQSHNGGRDVASQMIASRQEDKRAGIITEKYSGLRIKNPLVSSEQMKQRMDDRKMVKIKNLSSKKTFDSAEEDLVTIGVLVDKLPPRDTVKGKKYSIWKLSDLSSQSAVLSLFLFGTAFQSHWKTSLGTVVAILNPQSMSDAQSGAKSSGSYQNAAFSINNSKKLMVMGISQDYTTCKGVTKGGKRCTNFASLSDGGYCDYHVRRAYDASRSRRMECQGGYGPSVTKGTLRDKIFQGRSKTELYYYGGQTFTATPNARSKSESAMKESSSRLFTPGSSEMFTKMLRGQSTGARVLTQHQKGQEASGSLQSGTVEKSPSEILKQHQSFLPLLGRGIVRGGDYVDLFSPPPSLAKRKAISIVQKNGSISHCPASTEKVMQKVNESRHEENQASPEPKRPKRNSVEMDALINAKSSHDWINEEEQLVKEEEYFDRLEKKENIETKKGSVTELRITVVHCKKCAYTAESPGELCIREHHTLSRFKALKRGFACKGCSLKTFAYDSRWPVSSCMRCGGSSYYSASIYGEQKGPVLPTEQLLVRGIEEKFMH